LVLLLALPFVPVLIIGGIRAARGGAPYAAVAALGLVVIQVANFRYRAIDDKSIDWQVALKLAALAVMALASIPALHHAIHRNVPVSVFLLLVFVAYLSATSMYAVDPLYSLISASTVMIALLFLMVVAHNFGSQGLIAFVAYAALILCAVSLLIYVALPSLGRMSDWEHGSFVMTTRLQGILGSANAAGATAGIGLVLLPALKMKTIFKVSAAAILCVCLVLSDNRMAIASTALAAAAYGALKNRGSLSLIVACSALVASFLLLGFALFGEELLSSISRSGSADEVASATGRTVIWSAVLDMWAEKPLLGYGFASSQRLLPTHPALFIAAAHTHNMYLEVLFAGGISGLVIFACAIAATARDAMRSAEPVLLALIIFLLVYGLMEPVLSSIAGFPAYGLLAAVVAAAGQGRARR
jgi:O-antigen ligase